LQCNFDGCAVVLTALDVSEGRFVAGVGDNQVVFAGGDIGEIEASAGSRSDLPEDSAGRGAKLDDSLVERSTDGVDHSAADGHWKARPDTLSGEGYRKATEKHEHANRFHSPLSF
jgi:hypothetical protein